MRGFLIILALLSLIAAPVRGQEAESNSMIVRLLEDSLSSDNRRIRLFGIDGLLASNAQVEKITVSDREGTWLTIKNAEIVWSRLALFSGRLKIDRLTAAEINLDRRPVPDRSLPSLEASPFQMPELPVSIEIGKLDIAALNLGTPIIGQAANLTLNGAINLIDGALDADLNLTRTDGPGGAFTIKTGYAPDTRNVGIDIRLQEPAGGLFVTATKMRDAPAIELQINGSGPVEDLVVDLSLATDTDAEVSGSAQLRGTADGIGFTADLRGALEPLFAPDIAPFFAGESRVRAQGVSRSVGGLSLDQIALTTGALNLSGGLSTTSDGFLQTARITGQLGDGVTPMVLPVPGGQSSARSGSLDLDFGNQTDGSWHAILRFDELIINSVSAANAAFVTKGIAQDIEQADKRRLTFETEVTATGLAGDNPDLTRALGREIAMTLSGGWIAGEPVEMTRASISGNGIDIVASGSIADLGFDGTVAANVARLTPFAGLTGRDLAGSLDLQLVGAIRPLDGSFDLSARGTAESLRIGSTSIDPLLQGITTIQGQVVRNETGLRTRDLTIRNPQLRILSDGVVSSQIADLDFSAELADLALVTRQASGPVRFTGTAKGTGGDIRIQTRIGIDQGQVMARDLNGFSAGFAGRLREATLIGRLSGQGQLADDVILLSGDVTLSDLGQGYKNVDFRVGPSIIKANLDRQPDGALTGRASVNSSDISGIAALFLQTATGAVDARLDLSPREDGQEIVAKANLRNLTIGQGTTLGSADLDTVIRDAFHVPAVAGDLNFADARLAGIDFTTGRATAETNGEDTDFTVTTQIVNGARLDLGGALSRIEGGFSVLIPRLVVQHDAAMARLDEPARLSLIDGAMTDAALALLIGDGRLDISGSAGEQVALRLKASELPMTFANAIYPGLGAEGVIDGTAGVIGPAADPDIQFDLSVNGLTAKQFKEAELPPINARISGGGLGEEIQIDGVIDGPANFSARITGTLPVTAPRQEMNLTGDVARFPLQVIDPLAGRQGLRGRVDGTFGISGRMSDPRIRFDLDGSNLSAEVMRSNGVGALNLAMEGSFFRRKITLPQARVTGPSGVSFDFSGVIPLSGEGLNIAGGGNLPLSIANVAMAKSGLRASGTANLSIRAGGTLAVPNLSGSMTLVGGTFVAPQINLRLENLNAEGLFSGNRFTLRNAGAINSRGGTAEASGYVEIDTRQGMPANLNFAIRDLSHTDGRSFATRLNSALTLQGPLLRGATLAGTIDIGKTEITIPEREPKAREGFALNIGHINATPQIRQSLSRAGYDKPAQKQRTSQSQLRFDIAITAPNQIFVRGRGLDGELGGRVQLSGTPQSPTPVGSLDLIRGRMNLLGRRVELTTGQIAFAGDPVAALTLRARTVVDDIEATISLDGPVLTPKLSFSSVPELPDDEILARIIFGRSLTELSPLQIARIASAIAELSGRSELSIFDQVRQAAGLDDLDFQTTDEGLTTLRAGKYIRDNVYSSIEADDQGNSKFSVNLDINRRLKARGTVDNDGNTSLGVFFERDY